VSSVPRWKEKPLPGMKFDPRPMVGLEWIGMNTQMKPFDDVRVRQAIQRAADIDAILGAAYFGAVPRATGLIPTGLPGHREAGPYPARDVDAARKLLADAGLGDGFGTEIAVLNAADNLSIAQVFQANLAEIGIDVTITPYESGTFWNLGLESEGDAWKTLQMYLHRWGNGPDPSWTTKWYTCEQVGIWNWERWCNAEYSDLDKKAVEETDDRKRAKLYLRMADLLDESSAYVLLNYGMQALAYRDDIVPGVNPDGRRLLLPKFRRA
jgi:peptide/nickel transport system substrate-binding protein